MSSTIKEVAQKAGVSTATVSRVFSHTVPVDERTALKVKQAASELRYIPSALGRSLSTRRTDTIGLLLPDLFGEFFSEVIRGGDETAQQNNYHLLVSSSHTSRDDIEAALKTMRGRVDGVVIMSPHIDASTLDATLPRHLPVVLLNCYTEGNGYDSLNIDNFGGAREMVRHIMGHGHTRVAIIKGTEDNFDARERLRGYRAALVEGHGKCSETLELSGNFTEASGYDAAKAILSLSSRPSAIFASNDSMAIGALSALRDSGVRVPDEMALCGFDDIPIAAYLTPALTSVHVGINNLGIRAVQNILHAVQEKDRYRKQRVVVTTRLSLRESCGCASQQKMNK
jgi:LacI family transcriptional regulator